MVRDVWIVPGAGTFIVLPSLITSSNIVFDPARGPRHR